MKLVNAMVQRALVVLVIDASLLLVLLIFNVILVEKLWSESGFAWGASITLQVSAG